MDETERQYITQRFVDLEKQINLRFEGLEKLQIAAAKALVLQREIDQTHFESLNHEAARIQAVLAATIPREVFEIFRDDQASRWEQITVKLNDELEARRAALAKESEARREELTPLRNQERFEAGRNLGLLGLSFTIGAAVASAIITILTS